MYCDVTFFKSFYYILWKLAKILHDFLYFLIVKEMFWKEEITYANEFWYICFLFQVPTQLQHINIPFLIVYKNHIYILGK